MKKIIIITLAILCVLPLSAKEEMSKVAEKNPGKKIAIVSLCASNYGDHLQGWNSSDTFELMKTRMNTMLNMLEGNLAADWTVVKAENFVQKEEYQALAGDDRVVVVPVFGEHRMRLFGKTRKDMIKAKADKDTIKKLAAIAGVDFVLIVYSEWDIATGKFVPTSKAYTKNVIALYDANGKAVYSGRKDQMSERTLGSMRRVVVNDSTIDEWVTACYEGVNYLLTN